MNSKTDFKTKRNYIVCFEIYNKKLKATVMAESEEQAKEAIKNKLVFYKVEQKKNDAFNEAVNIMDDILNVLNGK